MHYITQGFSIIKTVRLYIAKAAFSTSVNEVKKYRCSMDFFPVFFSDGSEFGMIFLLFSLARSIHRVNATCAETTWAALCGILSSPAGAYSEPLIVFPSVAFPFVPLSSLSLNYSCGGFNTPTLAS